MTSLRRDVFFGWKPYPRAPPCVQTRTRAHEQNHEPITHPYAQKVWDFVNFAIHVFCNKLVNHVRSYSELNSFSTSIIY